MTRTPYALGGASGHAGLFGTVDLLLDFAAGILGATVLGPESIAGLRTRQGPTRGLGWEIAHAGWSGGDRLLDGYDRPYRLHRNRTVDRFRAASGLVAADQPGASDAHVDSGIVTLRRAVSEAIFRD